MISPQEYIFFQRVKTQLLHNIIGIGVGCFRFNVVHEANVINGVTRNHQLQHTKLHMRQFDVFVNYLAFAGVTLGMHFFDDLIIRKIIYVYKTMPEMGTNAGKQCGKNIRMIGDNNF